MIITQAKSVKVQHNTTKLLEIEDYICELFIDVG